MDAPDAAVELRIQLAGRPARICHVRGPTTGELLNLSTIFVKVIDRRKEWAGGRTAREGACVCLRRRPAPALRAPRLGGLGTLTGAGDGYARLDNAESVQEDPELRERRASDVALRRQQQNEEKFLRQMEREEERARSEGSQLERDAALAASLAGGEGAEPATLSDVQRDMMVAARLA